MAAPLRNNMLSLLDEESDDSSDPEPSLTINKAYAGRYDTWRQKEVLQKLKDRYGSDDGTSSTSSSSEDDDAEELTPEVERAWLKAFAAVKSKDPKIYSKDVKFFTEKKEKPKKKEKKQKSMFLKDFERKVLLERGGLVNEDDSDRDTSEPKAGPSYFEEQEAIKQSIKAVISDSEDDADDEGLLVSRTKTVEEAKAEDDDYHEWLKDQKSVIDNPQAGVELSNLKDYWNKPDLEEGEKFLRDYILNKGYIDKDADRIPCYDEIVNDEDISDDEQALKKQEMFENKYNFRFEEPDADFIKNYPRTIQESVRRKDDKRIKKRAEIRERKEMEKIRRREDLKQLKNLKKKEIMDKLKKLREITGNSTVGFEAGDLDGDFDPEAYDRKMRTAFDDGYYGNDQEDTEKPVFSDSDEDYQDYKDEYEADDAGRHGNQSEPHCDDPEFNMDADFDPNAVPERRKQKKKRNRQLAESLEMEKPDFDPDDKTFEEYLDEYYKLDYDDMIGDTPCRFKYRKVIPNDFGLTTEEILTCPDRELNTWVSLRKTCQYRPENVERNDVIRFSARARNRQKKLNILASLRGPEADEDDPQPGPSNRKAKKRKGKKSPGGQVTSSTSPGERLTSPTSSGERLTSPTSSGERVTSPTSSDGQVTSSITGRKIRKSPQTAPTASTSSKRKRNDSETIEADNKKSKGKKKQVKVQTNNPGQKVRKNKDKKRKNKGDLSDQRLKAYGINPKKLPYMNLSRKSDGNT